MPPLRTEITEIVTGLGMLGGTSDWLSALASRPSHFRNVTKAHWDRLSTAVSEGTYTDDFAGAWANGVKFFHARDGLRRRVPHLIEWKGPHNPPGFDFLPADLRVDHVFLVSCKYLSRILANSSPTNLFERRLADRAAGIAEVGWYESVAPEAYDAFYAELRRFLSGTISLPPTARQLTADDVFAVRTECAGAWPQAFRATWEQFSYAVAKASAARWTVNLTTPLRREEMLWRLLRLNPAPYFVLGSSPSGPLTLRIGTPWDWRQHYAMAEFEVRAMRGGQPKVGWRAHVLQRQTQLEHIVEGHVEVRWSHGRFSGVEAKVYLDTPHEDVPGYFELV